MVKHYKKTRGHNEPNVRRKSVKGNKKGGLFRFTRKGRAKKKIKSCLKTLLSMNANEFDDKAKNQIKKLYNTKQQQQQQVVPVPKQKNPGVLKRIDKKFDELTAKMRDTIAPVKPVRQTIIHTQRVPMATPAMATPAMATPAMAKIIARKYGTVYIDFKVLTDNIEGKINNWNQDSKPDITSSKDMGQLYNSWVKSTFNNQDALMNNAFRVQSKQLIRQEIIKKIFKLYDVKIITTLPKCVVKDILHRLPLDDKIKDDNILDDTETLYNKLVQSDNNDIVFYSTTNEHYNSLHKEKENKLIFTNFKNFPFSIPPVINQLIQKK